MAVPAWWTKLRPWQRRSILAVGVVVLLYLAYMLNARWSNGHGADVTLELGTNSDGSMFLRCVSSESSSGVCTGPAEHATFTVHARDRVHLTVRSLDGGGRTHDFKVEGWPYAPLYPWVELELHSQEESATFTAWKSGTYHVLCELPGHEAAGMWGTFVVA